MYTKWHESYGNYLKGKEIIILIDNDKAGEKYGKTIAKYVYPIAKSVKIIPASAIWKKCPEKSNISDITEALGEEQAIALLSDAINKTECYLSDTTSSQITHQFVKASEVQDKPISFLWYPYLPIGEISLIYARGGTGKTFLICGIAADVSAGEALPVYESNAEEPEPANVLIISAEDSQSMLKQRIAYAGGNLDNCYFIALSDTEEALQTYQSFELPVDKNDSDKIQAFKNLIRNTHAKLLIIDPWAAYIGQNVDMNRANDVRAITNVLSVLAKELQIAIVIMAHINKKAQLDSAADAVSGSADLVNGSHSCLEVRSFGADSDRRVIVHTKCNHNEKGKSVCYWIISQGKGKTAQFLWDGFSNLTEDDLTKAARTGKPLSAVSDEKEDDVENRKIAIDIIKELAQSSQQISISYPEFKKRIIEETGENFLPDKPAKFLNSLAPDLRTHGIRIKTGKKVRTTDNKINRGFLINCITD
ncbi:MAG: AAA family ATPase [Oscillospiraceae bacterium]|nr:AAA family ATPase [Oscillospiraceae bacterium]